nr:hypothetical protein [Tanacetum cinerariifolium]
LKYFWKHSPKKPIIYHRGKEMDFWSFIVRGIDGAFHFEPKGGFFDGEGNSPSKKFVNNEALVIGIAPLNSAPPSHITDNIEDSDDVSSGGDIVGEVGRLRKSLKATASKVAGDASNPLDVESDPDIHAHVCRDGEINKDKAYAELERKCNEALQDLDKNPLVLDMCVEIEMLQGQADGLHIEYSRLDQATMVPKVVPNVATKLICSDQMDCLVTKLVKAAMFRGGCQAFEEVASLKGPFILENMPGYRSTSKEEFD